jgi:hypothetical protein
MAVLKIYSHPLHVSAFRGGRGAFGLDKPSLYETVVRSYAHGNRISTPDTRQAASPTVAWPCSPIRALEHDPHRMNFATVILCRVEVRHE